MRLGHFAVSGIVLALFSCPALAQEPRPYAKEEAELLKNAEAFVEAFHKGDAKALALMWTTDGDYTDQTGEHYKGREAIEKTFKSFFEENKGLKLRINIDGQKFVTADVAIEDGTTEVIPPDGGPPSRARYTIVHVKKDGKWLLSSVRDAAFSPPTNYKNLRGLEWTIGSWAGELPNGEVARATFDWSNNQNFITSTFSTTFKNIVIGGGSQWIGWDPSAKQIRSWSFETNGGFGESTWAKDGDKWILSSTVVHPDGKKVVSKTTIARVDDDTISFQTKDRTVDGKSLPDGKEVKLKRIK